ncbi:MAG TPA: sigma-70 family RNA polymerase sigma factor [Saprospiraceae bacterium]|nr:sigma-70 family RNA polymerase sigma factor [Saprospiraceae bacterium]
MNHQHGHPSPQDELFIRGIISGGTAAEQAMQELYLLHRKKILGYIANLVRRFPEFRGKPEDLMHDAFIVLVHRIEESDGQVRSLFAFWIGICKHLILNQVKKDERILLVCEPDEEYLVQEEHGEESYLESESESLLRQTFDQLGTRCQRILMLWIERYPMHEIARRMELSGAPMARKIKHECFKKLKNLVKHGNKLTG